MTKTVAGPWVGDGVGRADGVVHEAHLAHDLPGAEDRQGLFPDTRDLDGDPDTARVGEERLGRRLARPDQPSPFRVGPFHQAKLGEERQPAEPRPLEQLADPLGIGRLALDRGSKDP